MGFGFAGDHKSIEIVCGKAVAVDHISPPPAKNKGSQQHKLKHLFGYAHESNGRKEGLLGVKKGLMHLENEKWLYSIALNRRHLISHPD